MERVDGSAPSVHSDQIPSTLGSSPPVRQYKMTRMFSPRGRCVSWPLTRAPRTASAHPRERSPALWKTCYRGHSTAPPVLNEGQRRHRPEQNLHCASVHAHSRSFCLEGSQAPCGVHGLRYKTERAQEQKVLVGSSWEQSDLARERSWAI